MEIFEIFEIIGIILLNSILYLTGIWFIHEGWGYCDHYSSETFIGILSLIGAISITCLSIGAIGIM